MKKLILIFTGLVLFGFMAIAQNDNTFHESYIDQEGFNNDAQVIQRGYADSYNYSDIDQYLNYNCAFVGQWGEKNYSKVSKKEHIGMVLR
jgi:hypothetical protein